MQELGIPVISVSTNHFLRYLCLWVVQLIINGNGAMDQETQGDGGFSYDRRRTDPIHPQEVSE